ncbi:MAG: hypothetical protein H6648_01780 [Caldilineae bacterium]|nr:hypothetical protein [Chloroflexota bacterium]MCB9175860.1 hypothetical protein [Caldilineae bacterium]
MPPAAIRLLKLSSLLTAVMLGLLASSKPKPVLACDCAIGLHSPETLEQVGVDTIVAGRALSVVDLDAGTTRVVLDVDRAWLGQETPAYEVVLQYQGSMCRVDPVVGDPYLVAGREAADGVLGVGVAVTSGYCMMRGAENPLIIAQLDGLYGTEREIGEFCPQALERTPLEARSEAIQKRHELSGWGLRLTAGTASRFNPWLSWLSLRNTGSPYHPLFNSLVWKASCP